MNRLEQRSEPVKKRWFFWSGIIAGALLLGLLAFSFSLHGAIGLFRVNDALHLFYLILIGLGVVLVLLTLFEYYWLSSRKSVIAIIVSVIARLLTVIALLAVIGAFYYVGDYFDPVGDIAPQLMLAEGTQSSGVPNLAVTFSTQRASLNSITWGKDGTQLGKTAEVTALKTHVFVLGDLQPDAVYWYRINSGTMQTFTTPALGLNLKFAVISDSHFGTASASVDQMTAMLPAITDENNGYRMLFSLGDLVDFGFRNEEWKDAFKVLPAASSRIPTVLLPGNHDALFTGVNKYKAYAYPSGLPLERGTQLWHRIDNGKVHFLILDVEWTAESITAAQISWLEAELQSIPREDWAIIISHGFYYASGYGTEGWKWYDNPETIDALTPTFEKYGVDMVFSGHVHEMEVLKKNGVTYIINGPFGGELDTERNYTSPASIWYSVAQRDFVGVDIRGNTAEITFHGADGSVLYNYTVTNR